MRKIIWTLLVIFSLVAAVVAQKDNWSGWTDKDVKRILDSSGWGQVQTEASGNALALSASVDSMTARSSGSSMSTQSDRPSGSERNGGAGNTTVQASSGPSSVDFHIRLLSARPIREAIIRDMELTTKTPANDAQKGFIDLKAFEKYVVVSVYVDPSKGGSAMGAFRLLKGLTADNFNKDNTYLERQDGKRLTLQDFRAASGDPLGARFFFPRTDADGKPFLAEDSGTLKFCTEITPSSKPDQKNKPTPIKLTAKYKVSDMMSEGKLEY